MSKYYTYKQHEYVCEKCAWKGSGAETGGGYLEDGPAFDIVCKECGSRLDLISYPTFEETLEFGNEEEIAKAVQWREQCKEIDEKVRLHMKRVWETELKSADQLPDIDADEIVITLVEEKDADSIAEIIVLSWEDKEIWREYCSFEYYRRYLELGKMLKEKYGGRLVDFACEYTADLGGDDGRAFDKVREFRKSLSNRSHMSNIEFEFITLSGEFSKRRGTYWKALEFAKERHEGQFRDGGVTPYFEHITGAIDILRQHDIISDYIYTIAALHDVLEDTETTKDELYELLCKRPDSNIIASFINIYKLDEDLSKMLNYMLNDSGVKNSPFLEKALKTYDIRDTAIALFDWLNNRRCREIIEEVELLTHKKEDSFKEYIDRIFTYDNIEKGLRHSINGAALVKLADRLHNLNTLPFCGNPEKVKRKIRETEEFIMPWREDAKNLESLFAAIEKQLKALKGL